MREKTIFEKIFDKVNNIPEAKEPKDTEAEELLRRVNKSEEDVINKKAVKKAGGKVKEAAKDIGPERCKECNAHIGTKVARNYNSLCPMCWKKAETAGEDVKEGCTCGDMKCKTGQCNNPKTLKVDQSDVVFKKNDSGFANMESVDFRSLYNGIHKDIAEGYGETAGVLDPNETEEENIILKPGKKVSLINQDNFGNPNVKESDQSDEMDKIDNLEDEVPAEDKVIEDPKEPAVPEEVIQVPTTDIVGQDGKISQEMDQSASRNAEVLAKEIALKAEVGQDSQQEQADATQTSAEPSACVAGEVVTVTDLNIENPNGEIVTEEPAGEIVVTEEPVVEEPVTEPEVSTEPTEELVDKEADEELTICKTCGKNMKDCICDKTNNESKDKFGRNWKLPKNELCSKCGQPDSCGDCNCKKLSDEDVNKLKETKDKNWMKKAFSKNKGGLHKALKVDPDKKIPADKLEKATHSKNAHVRKMANAAKNASEAVNEDGAYDVMRGQAGNRVIIRWKYRDSSSTMSSHFASVEEFLTQNTHGRRPVEWYQVGSGEKVAMTESKLIKENENKSIEEITQGIINGTDRYFGYAHFHASNMADYTLMSTTISDMENVYGISPEEAAEIVQSLTHGDIGDDADFNNDNESRSEIKEFGVSEMSSFREIFEGARKESKKINRSFRPMREIKVNEAKCPKCGKPMKEDTEGDMKYCQGHGIGETKVNEDETMTGNSATVATDAGSVVAKEPETKPAQNPETFTKDSQPEAEEQGEKEYFGKHGDDNYFYILATSDEGDGSVGGVTSEAKVKEGNLHVDIDDEEYRRVEKKLRNAQDLDDKDKEIIAKMTKAHKETEDLEKTFKMDNTGVPNESKALMRIPKTWFTHNIREAISKMLIKEGYSSLQIVDAEGKVVADAEEQDLDPNNMKEFLLKNMDDLELTEITPDIVKEYLLADEDSTEDDLTKTPEEEKTMKTQGEPPTKGEEVKPGENVASESKSKSKAKELSEKVDLNEKDISVGSFVKIRTNPKEVFEVLDFDRTDGSYLIECSRIRKNKYSSWVSNSDIIEKVARPSDLVESVSDLSTLFKMFGGLNEDKLSEEDTKKYVLGHLFQILHNKDILKKPWIFNIIAHTFEYSDDINTDFTEFTNYKFATDKNDLLWGYFTEFNSDFNFIAIDSPIPADAKRGTIANLRIEAEKDLGKNINAVYDSRNKTLLERLLFGLDLARSIKNYHDMEKYMVETKAKMEKEGKTNEEILTHFCYKYTLSEKKAQYECDIAEDKKILWECSCGATTITSVIVGCKTCPNPKCSKMMERVGSAFKNGDMSMKGLLEKFGLNEGGGECQGICVTCGARFFTNNMMDKLCNDCLVKAKANEAVNEGGGECQGTCAKCGGRFFTNNMMDKFCNDCLTEGLMEKFELIDPITVESLLEKFQLNEADPVVFKGRPNPSDKPGVKPGAPNQGGVSAPEDIRDKDLTGQAVTPAEVSPENVTPAAPISVTPGDTGAGAGSTGSPMSGAGGEGTDTPIGPVSAQDMSTPESAKAYLQSEFPEEPFSSTAIAYADSLIADPKVYGAVRNTRWGGIWGDKETLEKQAKIVGEYGNFSPASMKAITDKFGNTAKYKLARDVRPVLYITVRDVGAGVEPISISELKGLSGAREVVATENPGEVKIIY